MAWIMGEISNRIYNLHLLSYIDLSRADGPKRKHPHMRAYSCELYKKELESCHLRFTEVKWDINERFRTTVSAINAL